MQIVYKSVELRDQMLKMPFAYGLNMAHDRLQEVVSRLKKFLVVVSAQGDKMK
jgi:hypothetical protein